MFYANVVLRIQCTWKSSVLAARGNDATTGHGMITMRLTARWSDGKAGEGMKLPISSSLGIGTLPMTCIGSSEAEQW